MKNVIKTVLVKKIKQSTNSKDERIALKAIEMMSKVLDYDKLTTNKTQLTDNTLPVHITIDGEAVT